MSRIITLLSDFGWEDGYVASMKGVILGIYPEARLVDISHGIPPQDVPSGAFVLTTTYASFPDHSIHLAVVDPGVGTERRPLIVQAGKHFFVGPDNGLFSRILAQAPLWRAWELDQREYWLPQTSQTFHGRDIFAPVAAHLAAGVPPHQMGTPCEPKIENWFQVKMEREGVLCGQIIHTDHFGNSISSIDKSSLLQLSPVLRKLAVEVHPHRLLPIVKTYAQVPAGQFAALLGSHGYLEIAMNGGSAAKELDLRRGSFIRVILPGSKKR